MKNRRYGNRITDLLLVGFIFTVIGFLPIKLCFNDLEIVQDGIGELIYCGFYGLISLPFLVLGGGFLIAGLMKWLLTRLLKI